MEKNPHHAVVNQPEEPPSPRSDNSILGVIVVRIIQPFVETDTRIGFCDRLNHATGLADKQS
jgi:hypothetical protein